MANWSEIFSYPIMTQFHFMPFVSFSTHWKHRKMVKHIQTICRLLPRNCLSVFDHFVMFSVNIERDQWQETDESLVFVMIYPLYWFILSLFSIYLYNKRGNLKLNVLVQRKILNITNIGVCDDVLKLPTLLLVENRINLGLSISINSKYGSTVWVSR